MNCYNNEKDDILVELTLLGNEKAFEELVTRHQSRVLGTAYKVTGNTYSAEDASQDAFVSAWIKLDCLQDRGKFGSWVCSIAKNCAHNLMVHYRNTAADISLNLLENTAVTANDESGLYEMLNLQNIAESERDEKLRESVETLSEKIREAVSLHYFEGLSVAEISEKLSVPVGTVKWRLCEGRKQLRKEYGIMEDTYNENEALVARVMRQVEELKLWRLKNNKTGFEDAYKKVLSAVEELEESEEKQSAKATVLMKGYWWLPGEKSEEVLKEIKALAEASRNEDVMESVIAAEYSSHRGKDKIEFILNEQLPYLEGLGFKRAMGYDLFWLAMAYFDKSQPQEGFSYLDQALENLTEKDLYYSLCLAAKYVNQKLQAEKLKSLYNSSVSATGECIKQINGRIYFWEQPGYSRGCTEQFNNAIFWNTSLCDNLIFDPELAVGESITDTCGRNKLTYKGDRYTIATPCGEFQNCKCYVIECDLYGMKFVEIYFCEGVGIVSQTTVGQDRVQYTWNLNNYTVNGGEGAIPLHTGNRWEYACDVNDGIKYDIENVFEIIYSDGVSANIKAHNFVSIKEYDEFSWLGNMVCARREYCKHDDIDNPYLSDVRKSLAKASELAATKREKIHTEIATEVMTRILETDPDFNPDYTQKGRWNFFNIHHIEQKDKTILLNDTRKFSFEWKNMAKCGDVGFKCLYSWPYSYLSDMLDTLWSENWVEGYKTTKEISTYSMYRGKLSLECLKDEDVVTPCGEFKNCRHITFTVTGYKAGFGYLNGEKHFWYAPGVGIVKYSSTYKNDKLDAIWELTDYRGTGDGYFPIKDGLFRRYEPTELSDGWCGSVEYTFDEDTNGTVIFRNALCTQDRENYENSIQP